MSSSDIAIRVENLGKRYVISHKAGGGRAPYRRFSEELADAATAPFRALKTLASRPSSQNSRLSPQVSDSATQVSNFASKEDFWALKDVSFDVQRGEVVGIIGRNGAGKSTLLKILSRITEPTTGRIEIDGRVASLLEVGTGFHPELTGRENIFLNGAILGMTRQEIRSKFDEIVAFSEVEKFLDTPVKRYSSGMYVRLAFAVAAHLEPEILVVDEVLAVGDAEFQKKCLGKMQEVSRGGRTVLFVSHQTGAVAGLCSSVILLDQGKVEMIGPSREVIGRYLGQFAQNAASGFERSAREATKEIAIVRAQTLNEAGESCGLFTHMEAITVSIICKVNAWLSGAEIRVVVRDFLGRTVFTTDTALSPLGTDVAKETSFEARVRIPGNFLRPQKYAFSLATFIPDLVVIDLVPDAFAMTVIDGGSKYAKSEGLDYGCVFADCDWTLRETECAESPALTAH